VKGQFGSEFQASHCNQWGLCCIVVQSACNNRVVGEGERGQSRHGCSRWSLYDALHQTVCYFQTSINNSGESILCHEGQRHALPK